MTSLAQQLQRLAVPQSQVIVGSQGRRRKSLLFDPAEAAALDRETFYAVGINGLQELQNIDPSFFEFESTLFDEASKSLERSVQTKEVNDHLDLKISRFLCRLSPYFLLKPAQKALEWLINRFSVHLYNVDSLLACVLPYHGTNLFVRVVQLLSVKRDTNKWHWLRDVQTGGVPLARVTLTTNCHKDLGFLRFVCDMVPSAIKAHKPASSYPPGRDDLASTEVPSKSIDALLRVVTCFYCSTVIGAVDHVGSIGEKLLAAILPYILKGLKSKFVDYQASSYMITCQLAIKVKMKEELVSPIIRSISKHITLSLAVEGLSCIAVLCHTQPIDDFPESAFRKLCEFSGTLSALEVLSEAPNSTSLLKLFLTRLIDAAVRSAGVGDDGGGDGGEDYWTLLAGVIHRVKLDPAMANQIARMLLSDYIDVRKELWKQTSSVESLKTRAGPLVAALERRYPESMDLAISAFMSSEMDRKERKLIQELASLSVSAKKHQVLPDASTTLVLSLNHANPDMRVVGVRHLQERLAAGETLEGFAVESLLQRLRDDSPDVVNAVLDLGETLCKILPQEELSDILSEIVKKGGRMEHRKSASVKKSLELLANRDIWSLDASRQCLLVPIFLPYLFLRSSETRGVDGEWVGIITASPLQQHLQIFNGLSMVYAVESSNDHQYCVEVTSALIETMATNLANMEPCDGKKMIAVLLDPLDQPHAYGAFYGSLLELLLLRATCHQTDLAQKAAMGCVLLGVLERDVEKMMNPSCVVVKASDQTPDQLLGVKPCLPSNIHRHLSQLLLLKHSRCTAGQLHHSCALVTLWCLESLVVDVKMPQNLKTDTKLWSASRPAGDPTSAYLTWLLRLLDRMTEAARETKKMTRFQKDFQSILSKVILVHLNTPDILWNFLSLVWTVSLKPLAEQLHPVSPFYQARCLHIGVTSTKEKSMTDEVASRILGPESEVLPSLLVQLASRHEPIRKAAVRCVNGLVLSFEEGTKTPYVLLGRYLVSKNGEITADAVYVQQALKAYFSSVRQPTAVGDADPKRDCLLGLLGFVAGTDTPPSLQRALLSLLSQVKNETMILNLLSMHSDLLSKLDREGQLTSDEAAILYCIFGQIVPVTAAVLDAHSDVIYSALKFENEMRKGRKSPLKMLLKQLSPAFFTALPSDAAKQTLLAELLDRQVGTADSTVAASIGRTLRKLPLEAGHLVAELDKLQTAGVVTNFRQAKKARRTKQQSDTDHASVAETTARLKRVTHVVELLQKLKLQKMPGVVRLVPAMFTLLSRCLDLEPTLQADVPIEYIKQLTLTTVLNVVGVLSDGDRPPLADVLSQGQFNVELVVQCIRTSTDPQTHRHALMLLAVAAGLFPEHVLHNIMAIFTFMGASMLHQDDSYSFQLIIRTVQTVIPALIKASKDQTLASHLNGGVDDIVVMVMRIFVDALPHIPEHRRLPLFSELMGTVGGAQYLARMLALLVGAYVAKGASAMHPGDEVDVKGPGRSIDFWLSLCQEFSPAVQITSLTKLLEYTASLTEDKQDGEKALPQRAPVSSQEPDFDANVVVRGRQMRQFRFTAVCFTSYVLSNSDFVQKVHGVAEKDSDDLRKLLQSLLEVLLSYIIQVAQSVHGNAGRDLAKFWRALLHHSYNALDKVNALLPAHIFIDVISHLLDNALPSIRRKAMELLNNKLMQHPDFFKEKDARLLGLIGSLLGIAMATKDQASDADEAIVNRHTALYSLKLLCALLGEGHIAEFGPVLDAAVQLCQEVGANAQVQGSAMLCLAECVHSLRAHSIRHLPSFMPRLLDILASKDTIVSSDLHLLSAVTALQKVVETLPHFQSPYLVDLLIQICRLSGIEEDEKSQLNLRLKALSTNLAGTVATRLLLPAFSQAYERTVDDQSRSLGPLMAILSHHLSKLDKPNITAYQQQTVAFCLTALDYRTNHINESLAKVEAIEGHVIDALLTLVMKLSEVSFRPVFLKVVDWATRSTAPKDRLVTLYRLSDVIADKLKSLFTLFAGHLVARAADLLDANNTAKADQLFFRDDPHAEEKATLLLSYILDCLHKCFLYDKGGFVSGERFQRLLQPLVDQIENLQGSDEAYQVRISQHLTPCIGQLLVASRDTAVWQPLNYQVLLKTRHTSPKVRFAALTVLQELHKKLGEDYLSLLPETIPFLAELMEDESVEVEQQCQTVVSELEKALGEPLQKYF